MNRTNAVSVSESAALAMTGGECPPQIQNGALIYAWRPAPGHLAAAMQRTSSFRYRFIKRALDIFLSLVLLIALLPLGLTIALLIVLTSPGPIFYCEERVGRLRVPFRIVKFRSMCASLAKIVDIGTGQGLDPGAARLRKRAYNPRITPLGRILRRLSLDELPQLWNVLLGDMSLVGPRPIVEAERHFYGASLPFYDLLRPGITGLWQTSGRSEVDYDRRVAFDTDYARHWSCRLDLLILARTIPAVLTMRGAY